MLLIKRVALPVLLVALLAISSIRSVEEFESQSIPQDEFEGGEIYDEYSDIEEGIELPPKQEIVPGYFPQAPQIANYSEVPHYAELIPTPYQPQAQNYSTVIDLVPTAIYNVAGPIEGYQQQQQSYPAATGYNPVPLPQPTGYQQPAYVKQAQQPAYTQSTYQAPAYQAPTYQAPAYQPPAYQPPAYQPAAPVVNYTATQQTYQAPAQTSYQPPAQTSYQPPAQTSYQPPAQASHQPVLSPVAQSVSSPRAQPAQYQAPVKQPYVAPGVANYSRPVQVPYQPQQQLARYSLAELSPLVSPQGYKGNHWSLLYYRQSPYRGCGKGYLAIPTYADIQAAFRWAQQQLGIYRSGGPQFFNSTSLSAGARHHFFSFISQQNARMDEEGLLIELLSQYLADRACLTKWDKQRYLPSVTKFLSTGNFPQGHSCSQIYHNQWQSQMKYCVSSKYRSFDGFCNNPYHPYWGKSNVCHIRLLSPDYADGISAPRVSYNYKTPLPNPRLLSSIIHNDVPLEGPYNLMKMQWGQFINHDITNTALSSYEGLVDCCRSPQTRGCLPILVPQGDRFYSSINVTCLNFVRSGVCPTCQLGPRQQLNKNTAFIDLSQVYGNTHEVANKLRAFRGGLLRSSGGINGEQLLPIAGPEEAQCAGVCFVAGDPRVNQHPALTALHLLLFRNHNNLAQLLARRHPDWNDEILFQEARRINIAEYQMITYNEYLPIVFGPILSAYYKLTPGQGYTYYEPKADPTTWNEYSTATCRFGHSQIQSTFGLYSKVYGYGQKPNEPTFPLRDWFLRADFLKEGKFQHLLNGLLSVPSYSVDPWISDDVRNHLYRSVKERSGGDLPATNIQRGRDHGIPGYIHYIDYCFNYKVRNWKDLAVFIPYYTLQTMRKIYKNVENIDLWTGGISERHFPGADIGPTFACVNGIQYYHLKFGDRYFFEHGGQAGSFNPQQLQEIKRSTLARLLCRAGYLKQVPQYAFLAASQYNPLIDCASLGDINLNIF